MTVKEIYEKAKALVEAGYADAKVILLEDHDNFRPASYGLYAPDEYHDVTIFGSEFDNKAKDVCYLDTEY